MDEFRIEISDLADYGAGLNRPECVLCLKSGTVFTSNGDGGVTRVGADGAIRHILPPDGAYRPMTNGFALTAGGDFLLADLKGDGVWRLSQDGDVSPFLQEVDGMRLGSTNFVGVDARGRVWATVSTTLERRQRAYRGDVANGYIVLVDAGGARIVAEGIGYTNEAIVDPSGDWLVVNETFARRTSRHAIAGDGSLGPRETLTEYGAGTYPDGLAFDEEGALWVTSVVSNRLIRVTSDGGQALVFEDCDAAALAAVETAFQAGEMDAGHMAKVVSKRARSISSIAFGGPDRRTGYLGNLLDDRIYTFRGPVAGAEPSHWNLDL